MSLPLILYKNIFSAITTATDTASGDFSPANITDYRTYTFWKAASTGTKYLTVDNGADVAADTICIIGHNLGLAGATVSVESSATGAWAGEEIERLAGFVPADDYAVCKIFTQATARYWRVKIISATTIPQIAIINLGARMDFPVYPNVPFTPVTEKVKATVQRSKGGHLLGVSTYYSEMMIKAKFTYPPMSFIDGDFQDFWRDHGRELRPFFWVPNLTEWPSKVYFVRFPARARHGVKQSDVTNADSLSLSFEGVVE